jgi:hypothetical protein
MKVLEIKDIVRKDVPIYYRLLYTGIAVLELVNGPVEKRVDFSIEIKPTGQREIIVTLVDPVDYPLVPLIKAVKTYIHHLHSTGGLPG